MSGTGGVRSRLIEHFGLGVSPDHEIVGWLGDHGSPHVVEGGGTRRFTMPRVAHGNDPDHGLGHGHLPGAGARGRRLHGLRERRAPRLGLDLARHRGPPARCSRCPTSPRAAASRVWRPAAPTHHRACFGVFRAGGHRVFKTCHYYVDAFSPDGRRVLAERSQVQWASVRRFAILGHDGHVVRVLDLRRRPQPQPVPAHLGGLPPPARRPAGARAVGSRADRHRRHRGVRRSPGRRHRRVRAVQPAAALTPARPRPPLRRLQPSSSVSRLGRDT